MGGIRDKLPIKHQRKTITLYHGTSDKFLEEILDDGLKPGSETREIVKGLLEAIAPEEAAARPQEPPCVFVTPAFSEALIFADDRTAVDGGKGVVFEIDVPLEDVESLRLILGKGTDDPNQVGLYTQAWLEELDQACVTEGVVEPDDVENELDRVLTCMDRINTPKNPFFEPSQAFGPLEPFNSSPMNVCRIIPREWIKRVHRGGFFDRKFGQGEN